MAKESPLLQIPEEVVDAVVRGENRFVTSFAYSQFIMGVVFRDHYALGCYLQHVAEGQPREYFEVNRVASCFAYDAVTRVTSANDVHIGVPERRILEHRKKARAVFDDPRLSNLSWLLKQTKLDLEADYSAPVTNFFDLLNRISPPLFDEAAGYMEAMNEPVGTVAVARGFYDGVMPLYRSLVRLRRGIVQ